MRNSPFGCSVVAVVVAALAFVPSAHAGDPISVLDGAVVDCGFGHSVAIIGDIDGDGFTDFAVGAPRHHVTFANDGGSVTFVSGRTFGVIRVVCPSMGNSWFGHALAAAGDMTGDGVPDAVVGAPETTGDLTSQGGFCAVISGADGSLWFSVYGGAKFSENGWSVAGAGDVNLDGIPDILVGGKGTDAGAVKDVGRARVLSGLDHSVLFDVVGTGSNEFLGWALDGLGDVDVDGFPDLAIGSPGATPAGLSQAGEVRIVSGQDGHVIRVHASALAFASVGETLARAGDVDGDGVGDVIIGAPREDGVATLVGAARVYSGANGALLHEWHGGSFADRFGGAVAGAGDLDGDGFDDLAVGSPWWQYPVAPHTGKVETFSGATGLQIETIGTGTAKDQRFGWSIASAADVNGDSVPDLIVGAPQGISGPGIVTVFSGTCGDLASEGAGCPGAGGFVPDLTLTGCAAGNGTLTLTITKALALPNGTGAFVFAGIQPAAIPMAGGCMLHTYPLLPLVVPLHLFGFGAGNGNTSFASEVPPGTGAFELRLQAFCQDPGVPQGFSSTNGFVIGVH